MIEGIKFDNINKKWMRKCPNCKKPIFHENKYLCNRSNKYNIICKSCAFTKITNIPLNIIYDEYSKSWYKICSKCKNKIKQQSKAFAVLKANSICKSCWSQTEYIHTEEEKKKISNQAKKRWSSLKFREKMTNHFKHIRYKNVNEKNIVCSYNPIVCNFINELNNKNKNVFLKHHLNNPNGEFSKLCYFADGYDDKNNIWFEYDEPYHENWYIKKKDMVRQKRIIGKLKCKFIRYSEKYKIFYEVLNNEMYKRIGEVWL